MAQGSIFRQKSLERAASPEQLDQYIRVSSPGAWTLLALIVALIVALGAFLALGRVPNTRTVTVTVEDGRVAGSAEGVPNGTYEAEVTLGDESVADIVLGM